MAPTLVPLASGVAMWLHDAASHDLTNSGIVVAEDGVTVIDAGLTPKSARPLISALSELTDKPVRRLVLTGSHVDIVGGSEAFPLAAVYGSAQTSAHLDQPANPNSWVRLHPDHSTSLVDIETRRVTHTVTEPAHLCPASIAIPVGGIQFENLAVQVPAANVVFAGALASFGAVPLGFEADFSLWIETLDTMATWGELFVPAHGPIGGREDLHALRNYLEACITANGSTSQMSDGPWTEWADQRFTVINVERAFMLAAGDPSPPPSMLALLGVV